MAPNHLPTWRIHDVGGGNYQLIEVRSGKALELRKGFAGRSTPRGYYGGRGDYADLANPSPKREQYWRMN